MKPLLAWIGMWGVLIGTALLLSSLWPDHMSADTCENLRYASFGVLAVGCLSIYLSLKPKS